MKYREKRIDRLKQVLERLSRGEIVQNRQLKTVLGIEDYARYCDDCREQTKLRKMLKDKPKEIVTAQHDELRNFLTEPLNDESTDVWLKIQSHRFFPFRILLAAPPTLKLRT